MLDPLLKVRSGVNVADDTKIFKIIRNREDYTALHPL